ncbi:hypothetical protein HNO88_001793 [Novosphingobium chloroacetimidivorans]|uniref:Uncharacterized protein n=1 Tax=Novosphingobium chloroacetimidivorans TaxID=1428314 RepID=A0A7W7NWT1_9SPHN|nr:hypothetical protein [Novosphingobium chloroacetimidivorans]
MGDTKGGYEVSDAWHVLPETGRGTAGTVVEGTLGIEQPFVLGVWTRVPSTTLRAVPLPVSGRTA